jgi:putative Holliday junction resolvase
VAKAVLGIDFGAKRVGLALAVAGSPPGRLTTLAADDGLMGELGRRISTHNVGTVVVGLPRNLDGNDTAQTATAREFAARLQAAYPGLTVELQDEALTTATARQRLAQQRLSNPQALLDQEAAAIILEDYLRA